MARGAPVATRQTCAPSPRQTDVCIVVARIPRGHSQSAHRWRNGPGCALHCGLEALCERLTLHLVRCTLACYTQLVGTCSLMATWMRCLQTASKDARHPLHRHACVPTTDSHVRSTGHLRATTPCVPAACTLACKARPERDTVYALVALTPPKKGSDSHPGPVACPLCTDSLLSRSATPRWWKLMCHAVSSA